MHKHNKATTTAQRPGSGKPLSYWRMSLGQRAKQVKQMTFNPIRVDLTQFAEPAVHRSPFFGIDTPSVAKRSQRPLVSA